MSKDENNFKSLTFTEQLGVWLVDPVVSLFSGPTANSSQEKKVDEGSRSTQTSPPGSPKVFAKRIDPKISYSAKEVVSTTKSTSSLHTSTATLRDPFEAEKKRFDDLMKKYDADFDRFQKGLPKDLKELHDRYELHLEIAPYTKEETKVELDGMNLKVTAVRHKKDKVTTAKLDKSEVADGTYARTVTLPDDANLDSIEPTFDKEGKLKVRIMKKTVAKTKPIPIVIK